MIQLTIRVLSPIIIVAHVGITEKILDVNKLYTAAISGTKREEDHLFTKLSEIFMLFVRQRVWNAQDCLEIVQDALAAVAQKYRAIEIDISFSAWAYKILENKLMNYYRAKKVRESRLAQLQESDGHESISPVNPLLEKRPILIRSQTR